MTQSNPYCAMPFVHIKQFQNHVFGPCCEFENSLQYQSNKIKIPQVEKPYDGPVVSLTGSFNSEYFKEIRKEMLEGKIPAGCERCTKKENIGVGSYRQWANENFNNPKNPLKELHIEQDLNEVRGLDISFSNECNLTCRMCGPSYSTKWSSVYGKFESLYNKEWSRPTNYLGTWKVNTDNISKFTKLEYVKIMGGEPFISKEHDSFIESIPNDVIKNIYFEYNTNSTIFPKKEVIEKLKNAKGGVLKLSIDGIGELNEYIRPGVSWKNIDKVIRLWHNFVLNNSKWIIQFAPCWQALNIQHLHEYVNYVKQFEIESDRFDDSHISDIVGGSWYSIGSNRVLTPEPLAINILPKKYKQKLIKKYTEKIPLIKYNKLTQNLINYLRDENDKNKTYKKVATMKDFNEYNLAIDTACNVNVFVDLNV
tara:strand:- start:1155 stop:2423 length:1269 start_codon:yes stop_codon:yes gene_type:complete